MLIKNGGWSTQYYSLLKALLNRVLDREYHYSEHYSIALNTQTTG